MNNIFNAGLRGFGLLIRFAFVFVLAYYFSNAEVAYFGIVSSVVGYLAMILSVEFHNYVTKQVVLRADKISKICINSIFTITAFSLLAIPFSLLVVDSRFIQTDHLVLIAAIVFFEALSMDTVRMLNALSKQLIASYINFIRSVLWCLFIMLLIYFNFLQPTLELILEIWMVGVLCAFVLGTAIIISFEEFSFKYIKIDLEWIKTGLKTASPMIPVGLVYQAFFTVDKLIMGLNNNSQAVSSYMIYASCAIAVLGLLDSGIFVFYLPKYINAVGNKSPSDLSKITKKLYSTVSLSVIVFYSIISIFIVIFFNATDREIYLNYFFIYVCLAIAYSFFALSCVPHLALYALNKEKSLMRVQMKQLLIYVLSCILFYYINPDYGVPVALLLNFIMLWLVKKSKYEFAYEVFKSKVHCG